jgi:hypothetical protein
MLIFGEGLIVEPGVDLEAGAGGGRGDQVDEREQSELDVGSL